MIPLSVPNFEGNEEKYVLDAVGQGWVSTGGAYVDRLEEKIAQYANVPKSVACQSGTAALHMSLIECEVGYGDAVIVPTLTFIAAVNPVKYVGAYPIFMDCDDSLCMDPEKLETFCSQECLFEDGKLVHEGTGRQVKAIVVVHVFGNLANMERIMQVAEKFGLKVIEDATEAIGTVCEYGRYKGKMAGSIGELGAYSFNGNKIITTGGGGMIIGNNERTMDHLKYMSTQSKDDSHFYIHNEVGFNYRMTNVQAAIGVAQMEELEEFIKRKHNNYLHYKELLDEDERFHLLEFRQGTRSNKWFYSLEIKEIKRDIRDIILELQDAGIQTRPIWGLIHEQKPYRLDYAYDIERAEYYSKRIINLPCSTNLTEGDIEKVVEVLKNIRV
ncbi:MAG: LegC family aminotransferase [Lachnospiraceae bacterium]|nr:LegC family aminotransferase [Lachnospiraceae bacterium]MCI9341702.1 LegC family aminotransferase [Lachnospiraceae bacterium]